jgi:RND family efflux transporter MFP subunit
MKCLNFLVIVFVGLIFFGCNTQKNSIETTTPPVCVLLKKVQYETISRNVLVSGNIEGSKTVKLGFMVSGKINYIAGEEGDFLKEGQLLASLDSVNYTIAKDIADANLGQIQDEYDRLTKMHERNSISESDFSKITNSLKIVKSQQQLQAKNLSDTRLYTPISGVLLKKGAEIGEIIGAGLPLFAVSNIRNVKVCASIPESDLHYIRLSQKADVLISSLDSTFTGTIVEVGSVADPASRAFTIKIKLNNPDLLIRPGMTAEVKIFTENLLNVINIPASAVLHELDNSSYVYVADLTKSQVFKRPVALGRLNGNNIELISGLQENEMIVVGGQQNLDHGSLIEVKK